MQTKPFFPFVCVVVAALTFAGCFSRPRTPAYEEMSALWDGLGEGKSVNDASGRVNLWPFFFKTQTIGAVAWPFVKWSPNQLAIRPLYNYDNGIHDLALGIASADFERHEYRVAPIWWHLPYCGTTVVVPFWWRQKHQDGSSHNALLPLGYVRRDAQGDVTSWMALTAYANQNSTAVLPLYHYHHKRNARALTLFPLLSHAAWETTPPASGDKPQRRYTSANAGPFWWFWRNEDGSSTNILLPIGYLRRDAQDKVIDWMALTALSDKYNTVFFPLYHYGAKDKKRILTLFPLLSHVAWKEIPPVSDKPQASDGKPRSAITSANATLWWWYRRHAVRKHGLFPLYYDRLSYDRHQKPRSHYLNILGPLYNHFVSYDGNATSYDVLFPLYYRRYTDSTNRMLTPFIGWGHKDGPADTRYWYAGNFGSYVAKGGATHWGLPLYFYHQENAVDDQSVTPSGSYLWTPLYHHRQYTNAWTSPTYTHSTHYIAPLVPGLFSLFELRNTYDQTLNQLQAAPSLPDPITRHYTALWGTLYDQWRSRKGGVPSYSYKGLLGLFEFTDDKRDERYPSSRTQTPLVGWSNSHVIQQADANSPLPIWHPLPSAPTNLYTAYEAAIVSSQSETFNLLGGLLYNRYQNRGLDTYHVLNQDRAKARCQAEGVSSIDKLVLWHRHAISDKYYTGYRHTSSRGYPLALGYRTETITRDSRPKMVDQSKSLLGGFLFDHVKQRHLPTFDIYAKDFDEAEHCMTTDVDKLHILGITNTSSHRIYSPDRKLITQRDTKLRLFGFLSNYTDYSIDIGTPKAINETRNTWGLHLLWHSAFKHDRAAKTVNATFSGPLFLWYHTLNDSHTQVRSSLTLPWALCYNTTSTTHAGHPDRIDQRHRLLGGFLFDNIKQRNLPIGYNGNTTDIDLFRILALTETKADRIYTPDRTLIANRSSKDRLLGLLSERVHNHLDIGTPQETEDFSNAWGWRFLWYSFLKRNHADKTLKTGFYGPLFSWSHDYEATYSSAESLAKETPLTYSDKRFFLPILTGTEAYLKADGSYGDAFFSLPLLTAISHDVKISPTETITTDTTTILPFGLLYKGTTKQTSKRSLLEQGQDQTPTTETNRAILGYLWRSQSKSNGAYQSYTFPFIEHLRGADGGTVSSFLWRLYRHEKDPNGNTSLTLGFITLW